jgi:pilus assembly protein Flp/PilA
MLKLSNTAIARSVFRFIRSESGATAIEYAMIASGIAAAVVGAVLNLGSSVKGLFVSVSSAMK